MQTTIRRSIALASLAFLALATPAVGQVAEAFRITDSEGGFPDPLSFADLFGWATCPIGDLDGNGVTDVAVTSFLDDSGEVDAGAVYVCFLAPDGSVMSTTKITEGAGGFGGDLDVGDFFGTSVAPLGDLDGDGTPDLAVGAYYDDDGGLDYGAVWILFLEADGTVKAETKISATSGGFTGTLSTECWFGWAMANMGDLDGDGLLELAVAADGDDDGAPEAGAVYMLSLDTDGTVHHHLKISATSGGATPPLEMGAWFGSALANLGDVDGDGVPDMAVGSDGDATAGPSGAAYVLFLAPGGMVKGYTKLSAAEGGLMIPPMPGDQFGRAAAGPGDLDGDGVPDLLVGADKTDGVYTDSGAVHVLFLHPDGTVKDQMLLGDTDCVLGAGLEDGVQFGNAIAILDDLDGSGTPELLIGAHLTDAGDPFEGAAWVVFLGFADCNGNGTNDACDILAGTSLDSNGNGVPDECEPIGEKYCDALPNSTGKTGEITAFGSDVASDNDLTLIASDLPTSQSGYVLNSMNPGALPVADGILCLGEGKGRHVKQVASSGSDGEITTVLDLTALPRSTGGPHSVIAGETWYFTLWHRDGDSSNFTDAVEILFK